MKKLMELFLRSERGAITVEFIVICAAAVVMGVAGVNGLSSSPTSQDVDVNTTLARFSSGN